MSHCVYATAWECVEYLDIHDDQTFQIDDTRFLLFTDMMSRKFDTLAKRAFFPVRRTDSYDHPDDRAYQIAAGNPWVSLPTILPLERDLLSLIQLTTNNGGVIITSDNYLLRTGFSYNYTPYDTIELKTDGTQTTFLFSGTPQASNAVDGLWGYHEEFGQAWPTLDTIQDAGGIDASDTTITVTDADAYDERGRRPRFQQQQLLRLGTADTVEMCYITGINYSANTIQVVRGVNGSTAAIAAQSTVIQVWRPQPEIKHALLVLSAHAYRRKDSVGTESDNQMFSTTGVLIIPQKIPQEVADMVRAYKRPMRF